MGASGGVEASFLSIITWGGRRWGASAGLRSSPGGTGRGEGAEGEVPDPAIATFTSGGFTL